MTDAPLIRRSPVVRDCNLARRFELIGDRWTLLTSGQKLSAAFIDEVGKPVHASDIEGVLDPAYTKPGGKRRK